MLDGKAIKSTDAIKSIETMMNIVTAYTDTGIALGQITVNSKSNERPAVRELIEMLDIEGIVITADAMHCQKETAKTIIDNKGDYVLQLKANQGKFYEDVYGIRTGIPSSEIDYIATDEKSAQKVIDAVKESGLYIPVTDLDGNLIFNPFK